MPLLEKGKHEELLTSMFEEMVRLGDGKTVIAEIVDGMVTKFFPDAELDMKIRIAALVSIFSYGQSVGTVTEVEDDDEL